MRFNQFDQPSEWREGGTGRVVTDPLGNLFEQAAHGARAAAKQEAQRLALCAIIAAYDRAIAVGPPIPQSIVHACEQAKKVLP